MSGPTIAILMLLLVAAVVAVTIAIGVPYLSLPIVFLALVIWGGARVGSARGRSMALDDEDEHVEFTDEDRRTLTPAADRG